jgi:hypothetical protein
MIDISSNEDDKRLTGAMYAVSTPPPGTREAAMKP